MVIIPYIIIFILGTIIGSFANVVIYRLKKKRKGIFTGRSFCPKCKHTLSAIDLIPILGYFILNRKCRYCKKKIPINYTVVEFSMGIFFTATLYILSGSISIFFPTFKQILILALFLFYVFTLITITFYDIYYREIPDKIMIPAILIAIFATYFNITPVFYDALIGALIPLLFFGLQIIVSRGEWMGGGDLRIGIFMGLILGLSKTILALFISYMLGSIIGIILVLRQKAKIKSAIPFGPMLSAGTFISLFFGEKIINWYFSFMV